jgi:positive regulator of sigma E activity
MLLSKWTSSVLVIAVPLLVLVLVGLVTGSLDLGTVEMTILMVVWLAGLGWIWRRR